jgi:AAT family amino acid transporter
MGKLNASGSPRSAVLVSSYGIVTALIIQHWAPQQAFVYIMGAAFSGLFFCWVVSLAAHISFRWRLTSLEVSNLPLRSPLGMWGSILGFLLASAFIIQTLRSSRINQLGGLVFFVGLTVAYLLLKRHRH